MSEEDIIQEELDELVSESMDSFLYELEYEDHLVSDRAAEAAVAMAKQTDIYDKEPAAVLSYTGYIPDDWKEEQYHKIGRSDIQAMAYSAFQEELYNELERAFRIKSGEEGDSPE